MKRLFRLAAFVLAFRPEFFALLTVQPLGVGLVAASLGDGLHIHARGGGCCRMICRRLGALRKSNTTDGERKNYCHDDSRFRHHIFLPTMWNVVGSNPPPLTYQACVSSSSPIGAYSAMLVVRTMPLPRRFICGLKPKRTVASGRRGLAAQHFSRSQVTASVAAQSAAPSSANTREE
jgi:hypothetical protein